MTSHGAHAQPTRVIQFSVFTLLLPSSLLFHFLRPQLKVAEEKKHFHFLLAILQKQRCHFETRSEWKTVPSQAPDRVTENNNAVGNCREMNGCNIFWETRSITSKSSSGPLCNHTAVPQPLKIFHHPSPAATAILRRQGGPCALTVPVRARHIPACVGRRRGGKKRGSNAAVLLSCHMQY